VNIAQVRRYALSLAEVTEAPHHHFSSFRVGGKIFVTVPPEETYIHVFVTEEQREMALALEPNCLEKLLWGGKVVGLRVNLDQAPLAVVKRLVAQAWLHKAPKKSNSAPPANSRRISPVMPLPARMAAPRIQRVVHHHAVR
jgi:hypothetical protein